MKRREKRGDLDLIGGVEFIVHESGNDAGFADRLISQENELVFGKRRNGSHRIQSLLFSLFFYVRVSAEENKKNTTDLEENAGAR